MHTPLDGAIASRIKRVNEGRSPRPRFRAWSPGHDFFPWPWSAVRPQRGPAWVRVWSASPSARFCMIGGIKAIEWAGPKGHRCVDRSHGLVYASEMDQEDAHLVSLASAELTAK